MHFETKAVQIGTGYDVKGSLSVPIYQTAIFQHSDLDQEAEFEYSRSGNPTRKVLEDSIAALDGGCRGFAFASGMGALAGLLAKFNSGDHFVVTEDLYGGTYRLFDYFQNRLSYQFSFVDTSNSYAISTAIRKNTRAIFIETPTNPLLKVADIRKIADLAKDKGILLVVDNTFLTPYFQKPLTLGADIVVYSASKFLGGHNDLVAGLIVAKSKEIAEEIYNVQNTCGAVLGPFDSWLLMRGIKTLGIRLQRQQENAIALARWLSEHPAVVRVFYPGLEEHAGHVLMKKQARGFGSIISFEVDEPGKVPIILRAVKLISFAESLGGVESLITFPDTQTHADMKRDVKEQLGINNRLLRLSVGIEDVNDLLTDLNTALA